MLLGVHTQHYLWAKITRYYFWDLCPISPNIISIFVVPSDYFLMSPFDAAIYLLYKSLAGKIIPYNPTPAYYLRNLQRIDFTKRNVQSPPIRWIREWLLSSIIFSNSLARYYKIGTLNPIILFLPSPGYTPNYPGGHQRSWTIILTNSVECIQSFESLKWLAEMKHSDWLKLAMWLEFSNQSALFQQSIVLLLKFVDEINSRVLGSEIWSLWR